MNETADATIEVDIESDYWTFLQNPDKETELEYSDVRSGPILQSSTLRTRIENARTESFEFHRKSEKIWEVDTESGNTYTLVPSDVYSSSPDVRYRDTPIGKCLLALCAQNAEAREQLEKGVTADVSSEKVDELNEIMDEISELEARADELRDEIEDSRSSAAEIINAVDKVARSDPTP
jgi:hypothetical protein